MLLSNRDLGPSLRYFTDTGNVSCDVPGAKIIENGFQGGQQFAGDSESPISIDRDDVP